MLCAICADTIESPHPFACPVCDNEPICEFCVYDCCNADVDAPAAAFASDDEYGAPED